jgi:hypothetical protein
LEVLKLAREHDCPWDESTCRLAVEGGHLEVLQWAREQDPPCEWGDGTRGLAAAAGHMEVLRWALENGCPDDEPDNWSDESDEEDEEEEDEDEEEEEEEEEDEDEDEDEDNEDKEQFRVAREFRDYVRGLFAHTMCTPDVT